MSPEESLILGHEQICAYGVLTLLSGSNAQKSMRQEGFTLQQY
jgi:hypothetical protein